MTLLESFFLNVFAVAAVMRLLFFNSFIKPMKIIIASFLLTVIVFLFAVFVAVLFRVSSFKNEDYGEGV